MPAERSRAPRRLSRRTAFEGRVFRVDQDRVRLPHGREIVLDIVRHPGSVVLVPQPSPRTVILIRQYRYAIRRWLWELPAGTLDAGERPASAARRECEEEIGWSPRRLQRLAVFYPTPGFCDEFMAYYRCTDLQPPRGPVHQDPDEQIAARRFTVAAAWRLVERHQVVDMKTIVGLLLIGMTRHPGSEDRVSSLGHPAIRRG
jgi:ADP-ribose pyrophosphatase